MSEKAASTKTTTQGVKVQLYGNNQMHVEVVIDSTRPRASGIVDPVGGTVNFNHPSTTVMRILR